MQKTLLILGRNKQLRLALVVLFTLPVLFNIVALWNEVGFDTFLRTITGTYTCYSGFVCNPLPEILFELTGISFILTALALLLMVMVTLSVLRRLPSVLRFLFRLFVIIASSVVFSNVSGVFMPLSWLPVFNDYLLGLPVSTFAVIGSWIVVFPTTLVVLFLTVRVLEKTLEQPTNNVVSGPGTAG